MKSAIEQIYHGNFGRMDMIPISAKQKQLLQKVIELDHDMTELIKENAEATELYETVVDAIEEYSAEAAWESYRSGFRNGFLLALDVLAQEDTVS